MSSRHAMPFNESTLMKTWPAVRQTSSGLRRFHHFYRAPAKVVVIRRNPLQAPGVDAFLPFGSRRDCQETFLVVMLYLRPLPSHAELAADFSKALFHRVVPLLLIRKELSDMNSKKPVCTQVLFACKAAWLFILAHFSFNSCAMSKKRSKVTVISYT